MQPKHSVIRDRAFTRFTICLGALVSMTGAVAEGFRNPPAGPYGLGRAGGRIAHVDDSSSVVHNVANMVDLPAPELSIAPTLVHIKTEFTSVTGAQSQTKDPWKALPNLFFVTPLAEGKYAIGLGLTTPYGLSNEWEKDGAFSLGGPLRYTAPYFSELQTINASPSFAVKLNEKFQVGVGLNVMWSQLTFRQYYPYFALPIGVPLGTESSAELEGDGIGFGGNLGATYQVTERQRLAVTYRTPMKVEYEGQTRFDEVIPQAAAIGVQRESLFESSIDFPGILAVGYGVELCDTVRVEADVEWVQFSRFDDLPLNLGANSFLFPASIREDWDDTFTIGIAGDWKFAPQWVARLGYQFYESPVPSDTLSPTIPDADQNAFTAGLGWHTDKHRLDLGYGAIFYDKREITANQNPAYLGRYESMVHLISLGYSFRF